MSFGWLCMRSNRTGKAFRSKLKNLQALELVFKMICKTVFKSALKQLEPVTGPVRAIKAFSLLEVAGF
jgi:hypothetical protein